MLNVMMGILAFFVMITMSLTAQMGVEVALPNNAATPPQEPAPDPLIIQLDPQGQQIVNGQPIPAGQLDASVRSYLAAAPKGFIILQADRQLSYEQVVQTLEDLKAIGGDRVSLAID